MLRVTTIMYHFLLKNFSSFDWMNQIRQQQVFVLFQKREDLFLRRLLSQDTINGLDYGFYSKVDWKLHFQVVALIHINDVYNAKGKFTREEPMKYKKPDGKHVNGSVDFVLQLHDKGKIAIELKAERYWKEKKDNAVFSGKTAKNALKKDIDKLRTQSPEIDKGKKSDRKWSVIIARTYK